MGFSGQAINRDNNNYRVVDGEVVFLRVLHGRRDVGAGDLG